MPYIRPSQRIKKKLEGSTELNVVPVMNLFLVIIPFLLLAVAFAKITVLDSTLPASGEAPEEQAKKEKDKPKLNLTIIITDKGFHIAGTGGVVVQRGKKIAVPRLSDGKYDFDKLAKKISFIKKKFPEENNVIVIAEDSINYQIVIRTMDVIDRNFRSEKVINKGGEMVKEVIHPNISVGASIQ